MLKFIKYSFLVYFISLIILYFLSKYYDDLMLILAFFGIVYAPIGGLILSFLTSKYNFSKPIFLIVALVVTIIAVVLGMTIVFTFF
ncbi:hypothetical protein [Anaerococcus provencensis]|uniref:hypothetical protein n=1 Tax=Anaerococcus provencensis TaxID=938293 RepID=UPI0005CB491E|nr:hypothetical protein [Anaerococcus provencensis]